MSGCTHQLKLKRRGMTLVETLVALSLMAALVTVAVSWMTTIVSKQGHVQDRVRWNRAADTVLDQIGRDITQIEMIDQARRGREPRVWIDEDALHIRTTESGRLETMRYAFNSSESTLQRSGVTDRLSTSGHPPLLGEVSEFQIELEFPSTGRSLPVLRVVIRSLADQSISRTYPIRPEDVER
jgi:prepilin-type N-terminal cleavage/methylation domain-containing protein